MPEVSLRLPKPTGPLLRYHRATTAAEARLAVEAAVKAGELADADFLFTAAGKARNGTLFGELPANDSFTLHVAALARLADFDASHGKNSVEPVEPTPPVRSALDALVDAQEARIELARMLLARAEPWYKHYVSALEIRQNFSIPTACVNANFVMHYNPAWFAGLHLGRVLFVLLHEAEHVTHRHITRGSGILPALKQKDADAHSCLLNIAADLEILFRQHRLDLAVKNDRKKGEANEPVFAQKFAADIPGTLSSDDIKDDAFVFTTAKNSDWLVSENYHIPSGTRVEGIADTFFERIASELLPALKENTEEQRRRWRQNRPGGCGDFQPAGDGDAASRHAAREAALRAAATAELEKRNRAGTSGRSTGHGHDEAIVVPERPTLLSAFIAQLAGLSHAMRGTHPSWARPDRYSYVTQVFAPARIRVKEPVLFAFDTSGSIGDDELTFAFNCLRNYQLANTFSSVHLCLWDGEAYHWQDMRSPIDLKRQLISRGGTRMSCVAEYLRAHPELPRPALAVFITDGCVEDHPDMPARRNIILTTRRDTLDALAQIPGAHAVWADVTA